MNLEGFSSDRCFHIVGIIYDLLYSGKKYLYKNISRDDIDQLNFSCETERNAENSDSFSIPMVLIGICIAVASFSCILTMAADLLHGYQNRKLWFPCKYFSLNDASITVIAEAMKLTVDLSSPMPSYTDQAAKLGSLGFMCMMTANLMPSLAYMDNKTLLANLIETYWTQKLYEWKQSPIPFLSNSQRSRSIICNSIDIILSLCIGFQKVVVVSCKLIWLIATIIVITWFNPSISSRTDNIDEDLSNYVLQIDSGMELAENTLKGISKSVNSFILKAANEQNNSRLELLQKSTGFKGVEIFDTDHVQPLLSVEPVNSWSLPIISLTFIAIDLPNIHKDTIESLLKSVGEGLSFTCLIEESLNSSREHANLQKTSLALCHEVGNRCRWLDNPLANNDFKGKTAIDILKWFAEKAKEIVIKIKESTNGDLVDNPPKMLIAANSMY